MATYYLRADGTAANKAAATGPISDPSKCMTFAVHNAQTYSAGDIIYGDNSGGNFQDVLNFPSSGSAGSTIKYFLYGAIINYIWPITSGWTNYSGNIWQVSFAKGTLANVRFNGIWGNKRTGAIADCVAPYDWYFASNVLYVYATSDPSTYYTEVAPVIVPLNSAVYANNKSYIDIYGIKGVYFGQYGINFAGTSNNINAYDCQMDSKVPGTAVYGYYLAATVDNIHLYNCDGHRCHSGIYANTGVTNSTAIMCRTYGNRTYGIYSGSAGFTYSYCHSYGNKLTNYNVNADFSGSGVDGGNNISRYIDPQIVDKSCYNVYFAYGIDDIEPTKVTGVNAILSQFQTRSLKLGLFCRTNDCDTIPFKAQMVTWQNTGAVEFQSHSYSHQDYTTPNLITIQYVGAGSACTMTIASNVLTTTVTGGPGGEDLNIDLTNASYDTISELVAYIDGLAAYTCTKIATAKTTCHSKVLADVTAQAIKASTYTAALNVTRLFDDEAAVSKAFIEAAVSGVTITVFVWPNANSEAATWAAVTTQGFLGGRGSNTYPTSPLPHGENVYALEMLSSDSSGLSGAAVWDAFVARSSFFAALWGSAVNFFDHGGVAAAEIGYMLDACQKYGTFTTIGAMVANIRSKTQKTLDNAYYWSEADTHTPSFKQTGLSPTINAGLLGSSSVQDIEGNARPKGGRPDIGVYEHSSLAAPALNSFLNRMAV